MSNNLVWLKKILASITICRLLNIAIVNISYVASIVFGRSMQKGKPISISIEPTTACNLSCPECPSGLKKFSRKTGFISDATIDNIISQFAKQLMYVTFYFQGEPLLHPKFVEYVRKLKSKNLIVSTSTNAHKLTKENNENIICSGLDRLIISLDGTDSETYLKYRKGGDFNLVISNIENFIECRKRLKSKSPFVELQFIVFKHNEHQIDEIKRYGKKLGVDSVSIKTAQLYEFEEGNELMPGLIKYSRYKKQADGKYRIKSKLPNKCYRSWSGNVITWDGNVVPCCFDKDADYIFGNIISDDYSKINKSKEYNNFRNQILKDRSKIDICRNCTEGL
ncbi:MAG: SPASM domain-containing protein [Bacteroidales bacterium]|nr:SPASM domain-containing protein [Bacteroidales bacterium]